MKDTVIKNTGNSRFLKSAITSSTTWEQFRAMLIAGSLPIDLNGLNLPGIQQQGTLLNTANLLPASVCTSLGLTAETAVPADALAALAAARKYIATGTYTGTGTHGASNPTSLTLPFPPKIVFVSSGTTAGSNARAWMIDCGMTLVQSSTTGVYNTVVFDGNTVSWYNDDSNAWFQLNSEGRTYTYVAIG